MGMTSAAEAKLDARIRPDIAAMRSRTPYPKRRRPASTSTGEAGQAVSSATVDASVDSGPMVATARLVPAALEAVASEAAPSDAAASGAAASNAPPSVAVASEAAPSDAVASGAVASGAMRSAAAAAAKVGRPAVARPASARSATSGPAPRPGPIRLTRRGRMVVGCLVVLAAATAAGLLWLVVATQAQASSHVGPGQVAGSGLTQVIVQPGQSLWTIASREDPTADPRAVIQQIIDENSLAGTAIRAGQVLWVPRG